MFRLLIKKYLSESWILWSACGLILFSFPWFRIWAVSQFELSGFAPLIDQFKNLERFSPVPLSQFLTHEGMIGLTFAEPILLLGMLTFAIARGSDVVSGELGRGTLEMMLAQPIPRLQLFAAHGLVGILGLAGLSLCVWLGLYCGIHTQQTTTSLPKTQITLPGLEWSVANPFEKTELALTPVADLVSPSLYIAPTLNLFALAFFLFALSVLMSSWELYRWRTIGLVIGIYVLQLLIFFLAKSTPQTRFLTAFSFFGAYQPDWSIQAIARERMPMFALWRAPIHGTTPPWLGVEIGPLGYSLILIGLGSLCYLLAGILFYRRDIPAPT